MSAGIPSHYYKYGALAGLALGALIEYDNLDILYNTIGRDTQGIVKYAKIIREYRRVQRQNRSVADSFYDTVVKYGDKPMIIFADNGDIWTFNEVNRISNRLAHYLLSLGFVKGDVVAIFMENHPKYMVALLALAKIGVVAALINNNLTDESLSYSINIAKCRGCIYQHSLEAALKPVAANLIAPSDQPPFMFFCIDNGFRKANQIGGVVDVEDAIRGFPETSVPRQVRKGVNWNDQFCYIYTSGTTGLPKASSGDQGRYNLGSNLALVLAGVQDTDRIYTALPLYHSSGQWFAMGASIHGGVTVVLRKSFSASQWWKDCVQYEATVAQYVGEIARFLLAQPRIPEETQHKVRMVCGVGMRPKIWTEFVTRFNVPNVCEMYGSTEGTVALINFVNKVGAVGYLSKFFNFLPITLIKLDAVGDPVRDARTGLCVHCEAGEEGEIIGMIRPDDRGGPQKFEAYVNNKAGTDKKIIRNVFKNGDVGFRSGDILSMDKYGYLYFRDRTGDTFRWRGENVSTFEVETVVAKLCDHKEAVCYGVEIPGIEGKAGMVAIHDPQNEVDLEKLAVDMAKKLPKYARPLFIRLVRHLELTGTYKLKKVQLQKEGYDIHQVTEDPIYFMGPRGKSYKKLDHDLYHQIQSQMIQDAKL